MTAITKLYAREILDSRGNPTVEVEITLEDKYSARAAVPSGASTGTKEAMELRDGDKRRFLGKGVLKAIANVNEVIAPLLVNKQFNQASLDQFMIDLDGTDNKSKLGANAILAISMAFAQAMAISRDIPLYQHLSWNKLVLPMPFVNIINGGAHADNGLAIQEFMIVPVGIATMANRIRVAAEIFHTLKAILNQHGLSTNVGDEGGFAPQIKNTKEAIELIIKAVETAGYSLTDVKIAIDAAANEFYKNGKYHLDGKALNTDELVRYYESLISDYPLISLEDPLAEDDFSGWKLITTSLAQRVQIVGDDIFVTNKSILQKAINDGIANSVLIKLNQIGTVSQTIETMQFATNVGYKSMVSHRSGETEDTFIAHLAVGSGCGQIKTGSMCRTDRVAKYNELLRIEERMLRG